MRPCLILLLSLLPQPVPAGGIVVAGPAETVFDWDRDRCATWDIPDAPARAWRGPDGLVRMFSAGEDTRLATGPGPDRLKRDCRVVHSGAGADDPAAHDDRSWLAAVHVEPSGRVVALAHVEFHGHRRPGLCDVGNYSACWWNSVVELGWDGERFHREGLVAALPVPYSPGQQRRQGYFNPSNIVEKDGFLHAFLFAEAAGPQRRGACLIRRPVGGGPGDWRAWDGQDFTIRFADPYREAIADPARHVCTPVPGIVSTISTVVRQEGSGAFLALTPAELRGSDGILRSGIWWMRSPDLIHWSAPDLLLAAPLLWRRDCPLPVAYAYPSLIDPDSASAGFATVDEDFFLYLVRIRLDDECRTGPRRDLIRLPLNWRGPQAE